MSVCWFSNPRWLPYLLNMRKFHLKKYIMKRKFKHQFYQYQQKQQSPLILTELTEHKKYYDIWRCKSRCWLGTGIWSAVLFSVSFKFITYYIKHVKADEQNRMKCTFYCPHCKKRGIYYYHPNIEQMTLELMTYHR